jgi:hypothetical protein
MELLSGHEKIVTKSGISLNAGTLNRGFTVTVSETFIFRLKILVILSKITVIIHLCSGKGSPLFQKERQLGFK